MVKSQDSQSALFGSIFPQKLSKGEKKKMAIVEHAVDLFAEQGVDRTSFDKIAKAMGTTRSHISYYFKEPDELTESCIRYMMTLGHAYTFEQMRKGRDGNERLHLYLKGYFGFFIENKKYIGLMMYFFYLSSFRELFQELQTQVRRGAFDRIRELIIAIYADNNKKLPRNLESITSQSQSLIMSGLIYALTTKDVALEDHLTKTQEKVYRDILGLLKIKKPASAS